ncbi:CDP-glycerol glycerophosphotransferase family protein [Nocardioides sp. MAHUQ-72]|uniref:CDP-glycerol glycerophosphotransferase family protein n=1 Tax=unclassified Nocardioides TaxID=2615069 RepID=UPI003611D050
MAGSSFTRRAAGAAASALPEGVRASLRRRLRRGADPAGPVSVVVVVEAVDRPRLGACLESALAHPRAEVLLCPVGELDVLDVPSHDRLRRLPPQPTWQEAADVGARAATAGHLAFVRGCDRLPAEALLRASSALAASGSVLVTGRLEQTGEPEPWLARAQQSAHETPMRGADPAVLPALAGDLAVGNKVVDRAAWLAAGGFGPDDDWLLSPAVARLLAAATRVDVLTEPAYTFAHDHGTRAYGATPSALPGLSAWHARARAVDAALAGSALADGWRRHLADVEVPRLLADAERADAGQWAELRELAGEHDPAGSGVRASARAQIRLAVLDRRAELEAFNADLAGLGEEVPTRVEGADVLACWPTPGLDLPHDVLRLSGVETPLRSHVQRVRATTDGCVVDVLVAIRHVDLHPDSTRVEARTADGTALSVAPLPPAEATRWAASRFQAALAVRLTLPSESGRVELSVAAGGVTRSGPLALPPAPPAPRGVVTVDDVRLDGTVLVVTGSGDLRRLRLLDPDERPVEVAWDLSTPGAARAELRVESFGLPTWLPSGPHRLVTDDGNVAVGEDLRARLPLELLGERHRLRPHLGARGGLVLGVNAPLAEDELGPHAQERLRTAYSRDTRPVDPELFYFESYAGKSATDSPRAIFEELRRRRPGVRAFWGVADHGQHVPEGATPLLLRSTAWYDVLARAGCLVLNTDVEVWFRRRPGQFLLQTFHGYPSKAMGMSQWRAKDYPPSRIREFRARGVDTWSAILTPTPEMTRHYREQYDYDGPACEQGYPRDDDLVGPGAAERRAATRRLLGIRDDQVAVLYAPTWRDHLAVRPRAAVMTDFLDVARAAEALGDDHVLLLRGHRFHTPRVAGSRVVDVTRHPEVNDLILASDAAVLDYSSLRFDYALTGNPMVFLVPDLEEYDSGSRSFLFPFAGTAPGPHVHDTDEVVAQLRDLAGLRDRYAHRVAAFNAEYNPWQDGRAAARVVDFLEASGR